MCQDLMLERLRRIGRVWLRYIAIRFDVCWIGGLGLCQTAWGYATCRQYTTPPAWTMYVVAGIVDPWGQYVRARLQLVERYPSTIERLSSGHGIQYGKINAVVAPPNTAKATAHYAETRLDFCWVADYLDGLGSFADDSVISNFKIRRWFISFTLIDKCWKENDSSMAGKCPNSCSTNPPRVS